MLVKTPLKRVIAGFLESKMKIKKDFMLRDMGEFSVVIATGEELKNFNGMITLNESGKLLWQTLEKGAQEFDLVNALLNEYEVSKEIAEKDVKLFVEKLKNANILE